MDNFFKIHPLIKPDIFLSDAAFDSISIYKYLLEDTCFKRAYIPLKNKLSIPDTDYKTDAYGIPCCPNAPSLPMKREGSKSPLRCGWHSCKYDGILQEINARMILYNFCELVTSHAGIPVECTTSVNTDTRRLVASINIESPQVASLISRWNELNNEQQSDKIDTDEYSIWIDSMMNSFNIPIENY